MRTAQGRHRAFGAGNLAEGRPRDAGPMAQAVCGVGDVPGLLPVDRFRFGDWAGLRYALLLADTFALCLGATLAASEGEHRRSLGRRGKMQRAKAR